MALPPVQVLPLVRADHRHDRLRVAVLVGQLLQKIEEDAGAPRILLTEPGVGYRLSWDEK